MKKYILYFFILTSVVYISSCQTDEEFPPEPSISFIELIAYNEDSAHFTFSFTDGDGDLGLSESDTAAPFDFNAFFTYSEFVNNEWNDFELGDLGYYYRIPTLHDGPNPKAVSGEITVTLIPYFNASASALSDTFKWSLYIQDKALNQSQTIESESYIKP